MASGDAFQLAGAPERRLAYDGRPYTSRWNEDAEERQWTDAGRETTQRRRNLCDGESSDDDISLDSGDRMKQKGIKDPETGRPVIPRSCYPALWLWMRSRIVLAHAARDHMPTVLQNTFVLSSTSD